MLSRFAIYCIHILGKYVYSFLILAKFYIFLVLGQIKPEELGKTLTHEHVSMTFEFTYKKPKVIYKRVLTTVRLRDRGCPLHIFYKVTKVQNYTFVTYFFPQKGL